MSNSLFTRCDGTGVSINGYARETVIDANEFVWMGEGGVASWGKTQGVDATAMQQPLGTRVTGNLCHEIGHYEKQVSCYFEAVSGMAYVAENIMYNMPRAGLNFNDDAIGGSLITRNLMWNTCRESQDHGVGTRAPRRAEQKPPFSHAQAQRPRFSQAPHRDNPRRLVLPSQPFNSWGRVPYLLPWLNGTAGNGIKRQFDEISYNFFVAGGGANGGALDHDDGSSFYHDHNNFFVYGGHKSDFDGVPCTRSEACHPPPRWMTRSLHLSLTRAGHAKQSYNNVLAFANVYGSLCLSIRHVAGWCSSRERGQLPLVPPSPRSPFPAAATSRTLRRTPSSRRASTTTPAS